MGKNLKDYVEAAWNKNFEVLKAYQKEHGDCLVPSKEKTSSGLALGAWVQFQRQNKKITKKRKQRLDSIGFVWQAKK